MSEPKGSPQAGAASVPLQVILAGSAAMTFDEACAQIFQEFDPPIVTGTYSSVSRQRQAANKNAKANNTTSGYENCQSEHYVPNSVMQYSRGGQNISGGGSYTEGSAFSYSVYDDQSAGTEHKWLTDRAKKDAAALGDNPTLADQLDSAKQRSKDGLLEKLQREEGGEKRDRIKDSKNRTPEEREALAEAAAECLSQKAAEQFEKKGVSKSAQTRKGMKADGKKSPKHVPGDSSF